MGYRDHSNSSDRSVDRLPASPAGHAVAPGRRTLAMDLPARGDEPTSPSGLAPARESLRPAAGGGQPLPEGVRPRLEDLFGVDFSSVRIHEGPHAPSLGARAYTQGTDIHFAPGQYDPHSHSGQALLGHELTHVVQQAQGRVSHTKQAKGAAINDDAALEKEADGLGARVARGESVRATIGQPASPGIEDHALLRIQRKGAGEVIQREVGFEIETPTMCGYPDAATPLSGPEKAAIPLNCGGAAGWDRPNPIDGRVVRLPKGTTLLQTEMFELQADDRMIGGGSDVEFVIPPKPPCFPETKKGRSALKTTMTQVVEVAQTLISARALSLSDVAQLTGGHAPLPNAVIVGQRPMVGAPQCTTAMRLDQVATFFESNAPNLQDPTDVTDGRGDLLLLRGVQALIWEWEDMGAAPGLARAGITAYHAGNPQELADYNLDTEQNVLTGGRGSTELIGLMTLLINYLRKGHGAREGGPGAASELEFAKAIGGLMARTDLGTIFGLLPAPERDFFSMHRVAFAHMVFNASGAGGAITDPVFARGVKRSGAPDPIFQQLTRIDWLQSIANGTDLLTQARFPSGPDHATPDPVFNKDLESLGSLDDHTEQVGHGKNLATAPVFELRRMRQDVPLDQWLGFVIDTFDYICSLNRLKNKPYRRKNQYLPNSVSQRY